MVGPFPIAAARGLSFLRADQLAGQIEYLDRILAVPRAGGLDALLPAREPVGRVVDVLDAHARHCRRLQVRDARDRITGLEHRLQATLAPLPDRCLQIVLS